MILASLRKLASQVREREKQERVGAEGAHFREHRARDLSKVEELLAKVVVSLVRRLEERGDQCERLNARIQISTRFGDHQKSCGRIFCSVIHIMLAMFRVRGTTAGTKKSSGR